MTTKRPRRQKKADRLLSPGASKAAIQCDFATGTFDEEARRMDAKWGVDRLPQLVPIEVAEKYGKALAAMNQAIRDEDPAATAQHAANCVRGMRKMDELAEQAGCEKANPDAYTECAADDGAVFAILHDERYWPAVAEKRPDLVIATKREVAIALDFKRHELVREVEKNFPQSEVTAIHRNSEAFYANGGDEIPF